ncbi:hypothetical protein N752_29165 [Desulforamulus aquiferis]|nr:LysM peptidoglycan-binding domain-containing protein [Desulforamulus aquiferis]RYD01650.1 hypothetical protein N752_29165 [Desulforamulus aquiferis]
MAGGKGKAEANQISPAASTTSQGHRNDVKPKPLMYDIKSGDSLWSIAKLNYGDGGRWKDIYEANLDTIGKNPNLILPGTRLVMP